ncbi:peptide chain release factor N(5)-glutamine methyltransferase [Candidatus Rariloculus sp.]|uniref:peptide chain release factor N(5)-glutamine methyltransferase n=1 Tax=Candidatus Rariloculus sp. TaxID=3101265 RepID=UPI003D1225D0
MRAVRAARPASANAARRSFGALAAVAARALEPISPTPRLEAELLLAHAAGVSRTEVIAFPQREPSGEAEARFRAALARRSDGEPLAYIRGYKDFHDVSLRVTPDVLIPRPETECVVEEALARIGVRTDCAVLDLGTGSGAIALAIRRARPAAAVTAVDASPAALAVARSNAELLGLDIRCLESRWFAGLAAARFDLIVCNPPYVRSGDRCLDGALRFEPRQSLDGGSDGLDAIRAVLSGAPPHLGAGGLLLIEHGHDQRARVVTLAGERGYETLATRRDLSGLARLVVLRRAPA